MYQEVHQYFKDYCEDIVKKMAAKGKVVTHIVVQQFTKDNRKCIAFDLWRDGKLQNFGISEFRSLRFVSKPILICRYGVMYNQIRLTDFGSNEFPVVKEGDILERCSVCGRWYIKIIKNGIPIVLDHNPKHITTGFDIDYVI